MRRVPGTAGCDVLGAVRPGHTCGASMPRTPHIGQGGSNCRHAPLWYATLMARPAEKKFQGNRLAYVWDYDIDETLFRQILAGTVHLGRLDRRWPPDACLRMLRTRRSCVFSNFASWFVAGLSGEPESDPRVGAAG